MSHKSGNGGSFPSGGPFPGGGGSGGETKIGDTVTAPRLKVVDHDDEGLFYDEAISEIGVAVGDGHKAAGFRYLEEADVGEGEIGGGGAPAGTIVTLAVNHATANPATTVRIRATEESQFDFTLAEEAGIGTAWSAGYGAAGPKAHVNGTDPLTIQAHQMALNVELGGADAHWNTTKGLASNGERVVTEKFPVVAASTVDADFATAFAAGATLDGVFLAAGDRVLIKNQDDASENGIYKVNASGEPTRANDGRDLAMGQVRVTGGTVNRHTLWRCTAPNAGLTAGSWTSPLPGAQWGAGPIAEPINFVRLDAHAGNTGAEPGRIGSPVLIDTQDFTAATEVTSVAWDAERFSALFVVMEGTSSGFSYVRLQFNGDTGANYVDIGQNVSNGGSNVDSHTGANFAIVGVTGNTFAGDFDLDLKFSPLTTGRTRKGHAECLGMGAFALANSYKRSTSFQYTNTATPITSLKLSVSGITITGNFKLWGIPA